MGWRAYAIVAGSRPVVSPAPSITGTVADGTAGLAITGKLGCAPPQTDHYLAAAVRQ
jgi:hypothetical protein